MVVAIVSDAGFGWIPGHDGKEVYSELVARINEEILGNKVVRVILGGERHRSVGAFNIVGHNMPILRIADHLVFRGLNTLLKVSNVELVHVNICNPRYAYPVTKALKALKVASVVGVHDWKYLCPSGFGVILPEVVVEDKFIVRPRCMQCIISREKALGNKMVRAIAQGLSGIVGTAVFQELLKAAHVILTPSKVLAKVLEHYLNVPAFGVPNPVRPDLLNFKPDMNSNPKALFIGRLSVEKGVHLIPGIAKRLGKDVKINIAGGRPP